MYLVDFLRLNLFCFQTHFFRVFIDLIQSLLIINVFIVLVLSNSEIYLRAIELLRLPFANYIETLLRASKPGEEVDKIISFYMDNRVS